LRDSKKGVFVNDRLLVRSLVGVALGGLVVSLSLLAVDGHPPVWALALDAWTAFCVLLVLLMGGPS
jgi:hypothetical protein